jgi:hypothetical protein
MRTKRTRMLKIEAKEISYHRNGVAGAPFYSVRFIFRDERKKPHLLIGIVEDRQDDAWREFKASDAFVAVIDPRNLDSKWRGDEFAEVLWNEISKFQALSDEVAAAERAAGWDPNP